MGTRLKYLTDTLLVDSVYGDYKTISEAVTNIGAFKSITLGSETHTITGNLTLPSGVSLVFQRGAKITGAFTITFDYNRIVADNDAQIFDTNVLFAGNLNVDGIYPQWWGAIADGVTVCTTAFQKAMSFMALFKGQFILNSGNYKVNGGISVQTFDQTHACIIKGIGQVYIDCTEITDTDELFDLGSTPTSYAAITEDLARGDHEITTALSVTKGDILQILSTDLWGSTAGLYKRELVQAHSTTDGVVTISNALYDTYDKDTTTIANMNSARFHMSNIKMKGNLNNNSFAISLRYFHNIELKDVEIIDFYHIAIAFNAIYGGIVSNCYITNAMRDGYGYGMSIDNCQNLVIDNNTVTESRHCIKMGTCTRSITVRNNYVATAPAYSAPLENHESCEYITFEGNYVWGGGILLRGLYNSVINNTIYVNAGSATGINITRYGFEPRIDDFIIITGNRLIPAGGDIMRGISVKFWSTNDYVKRMIISNNNIVCDQPGIAIYLDSAELTGNRIGDLICENNYIESSVGEGLYLYNAIQYDRIILNGCIIKSKTSGILIQGAEGSGDLFINNSIIDSESYPIHSSGSKLANIYLKGNHFKGLQYLNLLATTNVILQNNTLENMIKGGIKVVTGVDVYTHGGNVKINCTGVVENDATSTNDGTDY